jgi:hypothetical protein
MRRSYLRIRRNRTHNGRPYSQERPRERDPYMAHDGEPRPAHGEGESDPRAIAADLSPGRERG